MRRLYSAPWRTGNKLIPWGLRTVMTLSLLNKKTFSQPWLHEFLLSSEFQKHQWLLFLQRWNWWDFYLHLMLFWYQKRLLLRPVLWNFRRWKIDMGRYGKQLRCIRSIWHLRKGEEKDLRFAIMYGIVTSDFISESVHIVCRTCATDTIDASNARHISYFCLCDTIGSKDSKSYYTNRICSGHLEGDATA